MHAAYRAAEPHDQSRSPVQIIHRAVDPNAITFSLKKKGLDWKAIKYPVAALANCIYIAELQLSAGSRRAAER